MFRSKFFVVLLLIFTACAPPEPRTPVSGIDSSGIYEICKREADHPFCVKAPSSTSLVSSNLVNSKFAYVHSRFTYVTDFEQYQVDDYYSGQSFAGDCEDFAMLMARELRDAGVNGHDMILRTRTLEGPYGAHATLAVHTADKGWLELDVNENHPRPLAYSAEIEKTIWFDYYYMDGSKKKHKAKEWKEEAR